MKWSENANFTREQSIDSVSIFIQRALAASVFAEGNLKKKSATYQLGN